MYPDNGQVVVCLRTHNNITEGQRGKVDFSTPQDDFILILWGGDYDFHLSEYYGIESKGILWDTYKEDDPPVSIFVQTRRTDILIDATATYDQVLVSIHGETSTAQMMTIDTAIDLIIRVLRKDKDS